MARYIDANEVQKRLTKLFKEPDYQHEGEDWRVGVCMAGVQVDLMPTADVAEVKHGEWVKPTIINGRTWDFPHCSNCDYVPSDPKHYCTNCGAKMKGGNIDA